MIDAAHAAAALAELENVIKSADPEFAEQVIGINELLSAFVPTHEHAAAAMARGQSAEAHLAQARRQLAEVAVHLKNLAATMPAGDSNSEKLKAVMGGLK